MEKDKKKRITVKLKSPNPLFEKWLVEWRDKAKENKSKMEFTFNKALASLRMFPVPLESGRDCKILKGFGDVMCQMLDKKLKQYENSSDPNIPLTLPLSKDKMPEKKRKSLPLFVSNNENENYSLEKRSRPGTSSEFTEYIPKDGSGGYAILIALYKSTISPNYPGFLTKAEIIREAQHFANCSFTKPDPESRYTAWSSMSNLINKDLVVRKSNPGKFSLTDKGFSIALLLNDKHEEKESIENQNRNILVERISALSGSQTESIINTKSLEVPVDTNLDSLSGKQIKGKSIPKKGKKVLKKSSSSESATSNQNSDYECFIFEPATFDVILYVDTQETGGSSMNVKDDPILAELQILSVNYEVKNLKIGDYTWICRHRVTKNELVLPYIIERKRMDDLASSIKDGRYHEQKFRLQKSGIQNIIYLIEKFGNRSSYGGLPISSLNQAITNTAIQNGFTIKFTENIRDTARYLAQYTTLLVKLFQEKTLLSCPKENLSDISLEDDLVSLMTFKDFNQSSIKNKAIRVSDLFIKMLTQIKGMSVDRALAIVEEYPTPILLRQAYKQNPGREGEKLLAQIKFGDYNKNIGQVLSTTVYQLFTKITPS